VRELLAIAWEEFLLILGAFRIIAQELWAIRLTGPRAHQCTMTAISVALSVTAAQALHMDYVWWAGISGYMSTQATRPGSLERALLRIIGTIVGAMASLVVTPWLAYDHVAGSLFIFCVATLGSLGFMLSPYAYAWLFVSITVNLIVLSSLQDPLLALHFAYYRTFEVMIGSTVAVLVAAALAPDGPAAATTPRGWSGIWDRNWPHVLHAMRAGLTVMLLPWVWSWLNLPNLAQMSVTVAALMAVPVLASDPLQTGRQVVRHALQRLLGCLLGGLLGLGLLALSITNFLPWILTLSAAIWIGCYVQTSERGVGYVGNQAGLVIIMTLVQGPGPPDSIWPGIERFAGMMGGLAMLLLVSLLIWPEKSTFEPQQT
jgi:uncharacterized membrane protein YgaE (UPF0421/DUF939 family)